MDLDTTTGRLTRTYTGLSQPCNGCTHGSNGTPSRAAANAYRFPRNMIRSATASIPSRDQPRVGIDSRTPCSRTRHSHAGHLGPWGSCAACLGGAPPHTRSNNSGRTDFEYGYPLGMTTSKSTEVALTV